MGQMRDAAMGRSGSAPGPQVRIGIFLPERFPLTPLSLVIETLRMANLIEDANRFSYVLISPDGAPVTSSCDFPAPVRYDVKGCPNLDVVLVCAGHDSVRFDNRAVLSWLRRLYHAGVHVGGISSGAFLLARAGLLDGRSCAVHWECVEALREAFHRVTVSGEIFLIDGRIITCAGGVSTLDLMLHLVERFRDRRFAREVADALIYPSVRGGHEPARINLRARTGVTNLLLLRAVEMMERNVESPIKVSEISEQLHTSTRHLERLFVRSFRMSPSHYYMRLRLREARSLLARTDIPVLEVALRCGFRNSSHFTRRYREMYHILPSHQRRLHP